LHFILPALAVFVLDGATKAAVRTWLPVGESLPVVPGVFYLTHALNPGAAFGLLAGARIPLIAVGILALGALVWVSRRTRREECFLQLALGLQFGGTGGNLVDRVRLGHVTDFLDFRVWPIFNVADSAIVVGAFLLVGWLFHRGHRR
jgi:signal peptidase II